MSWNPQRTSARIANMAREDDFEMTALEVRRIIDRLTQKLKTETNEFKKEDLKSRIAAYRNQLVDNFPRRGEQYINTQRWEEKRGAAKKNRKTKSKRKAKKMTKKLSKRKAKGNTKKRR